MSFTSDVSKQVGEMSRHKNNSDSSTSQTEMEQKQEEEEDLLRFMREWRETRRERIREEKRLVKGLLAATQKLELEGNREEYNQIMDTVDKLNLSVGCLSLQCPDIYVVDGGYHDPRLHGASHTLDKIDRECAARAAAMLEDLEARVERREIRRARMMEEKRLIKGLLAATQKLELEGNSEEYNQIMDTVDKLNLSVQCLALQCHDIHVVDGGYDDPRLHEASQTLDKIAAAMLEELEAKEEASRASVQEEAEEEASPASVQEEAEEEASPASVQEEAEEEASPASVQEEAEEDSGGQG